MTFTDFEIALSKPRIGRFLLAANGDQDKALRLYKHHKIFTDFTKTIYEYIIKQTIWLSYDPNKLYLGLDETLKIIHAIDNES